MLLPRELIYRERRLEEFNLEDQNDLFYHFYNVLSREDGMLPHNVGAYETITKTLNTVCYICTDASLQPVSKLALGDYIQYIGAVNPLSSNRVTDYVTIVLDCIQNIYCYSDKGQAKGLVELCNAINDWLDNFGQPSVVHRLRDYFIEYSGLICSDYLITARLISDSFLKTINWQKLTKDYDLDSIRFIVRNISKDNNIRLKVIQSIRKEVSDNDPNQLPF